MQYISNIGFDLIYSFTNNQNISLLFKKTNSYKLYPITNQYDENSKLIVNYKNNLTRNRNILKEKVKNINEIFSNGNNSIIGCGRVLDAFIKYGELNLNNFNYLIDDYLYEVTDTLYNKTLYSRDILNGIKFDNILVLVKHPNPIMLKELNATSIVSLDQLLK